jgi:chromosome segregation ATPase
MRNPEIENLTEEVKEANAAIKEIHRNLHSLDKNLLEMRTNFLNHIKSDEDMAKELRRMNDILEINTDDLKKHMYRSDLFEEAVQIINQKITAFEVQQIRKDALKDWFDQNIKRLAIIFSIIAAITSGLMFLPKLLQWIVTLP